MGVSTLYVLDPMRRVRRILMGTASQLVHKERDFELIAEIPMSAKAVPGEYLGMACVDGRFRLFASRRQSTMTAQAPRKYRPSMRLWLS